MDARSSTQDSDLPSNRELYANKPEGYFGGARRPFVDPLPEAPSARLLEIGCGTGDTAAYALSTGKCGWAAGVELCAEPAMQAREKLNQVLEGDVETLALPFEPESLDVILLSEVLEHLRDPLALLKRLFALMKPHGLIVAGSPNVAHFSVVKMLLGGEWRYAPQGIMDATHLRWFTPRSYRRLFEDAGFQVVEVAPASTLRWQAQVINRLTAGRFTHLLHSQIVLRAVRPE